MKKKKYESLYKNILHLLYEKYKLKYLKNNWVINNKCIIEKEIVSA